LQNCNSAQNFASEWRFLRPSAHISVGVSITNHHAESDADMPLLSCLSRTWPHIQGALFPWLTEELGPLTETHEIVENDPMFHIPRGR
jgi:hypothetical protein